MASPPESTLFSIQESINQLSAVLDQIRLNQEILIKENENRKEEIQKLARKHDPETEVVTDKDEPEVTEDHSDEEEKEAIARQKQGNEETLRRKQQSIQPLILLNRNKEEIQNVKALEPPPRNRRYSRSTRESEVLLSL